MSQHDKLDASEAANLHSHQHPHRPIATVSLEQNKANHIAETQCTEAGRRAEDDSPSELRVADVVFGAGRRVFGKLSTWTQTHPVRDGCDEEKRIWCQRSDLNGLVGDNRKAPGTQTTTGENQRTQNSISERTTPLACQRCWRSKCSTIATAQCRFNPPLLKYI